MICVLLLDNKKTSVGVPIDDEVAFAMPCVVIKGNGLDFLLEIGGDL